jgi:hypothetical protein
VGAVPGSGSKDAAGPSRSQGEAPAGMSAGLNKENLESQSAWSRGKPKIPVSVKTDVSLADGLRMHLGREGRGRSRKETHAN